MSRILELSRRSFVTATLLGLASTGLPAAAAEKDEEDVTPNEDLMREHGLLRRILLIYEENIRRMPQGSHSPEVIRKSAEVVRSFIENYHEKLEEEFLFPALLKAKRETALVQTLKHQHEIGRKLTGKIIDSAGKKSEQSALQDSLASFIHMYRAHAAREDTVLFPAFKEAVGEKTYHQLGETFEKREHEMFGKSGFEGVLAQVDELEKKMGIHDLAAYSPKV